MQTEQNEPPFHHLQTEAAFEAFFKTHFRELCAFCLFKFKVDIDQSKELVHTAFIKLWESRHALDAGCSPKGYLIRIITNNAIDLQRHHHVRRIYEKYILSSANEASQNEGEEQFDLRQLTLDIEKAVSELPDQMRTIYQLSRHYGLKYREIAHQLDLSEKTVETQMSRALDKLRHKLVHHLPACFLLFL